MRPGTSALRGSHLLQQKALVVCLGTALAAMIFGIVGWTIYDTRHAARREAERKAGGIALNFDREISDTITILDLQLRVAVHGMSTPGLAALDDNLRQGILFGGTIAAKALSALVIADELGDVIYKSRDSGRDRFNIADRKFFQDLRDGSATGLVISPPLYSRGNGALSLLLARRIDRADGSFAGVATAKLNIAYFDTLFDVPALGRRTIVSLSDANGMLIVDRPYVASEIGHYADEGELFAHLASAPVGSFEATAKSDGLRRLYSYRHLTGVPLVVSVGLSLRDIYGRWTVRTVGLVGVLSALVLLGVGLAWALLRELQRREDAEQDHREARARLDAMFDSSADSVLVAGVLPDGSFVYEAVNKEWMRVSGQPVEAAAGASPQAMLPPQIAETVLAAWRECAAGRRVVAYTFTSEHQGQKIDWEALVAPVVDGSGVVRRLVASARDMTQRNTLEASLRHSQRMEAVGQLTAGIAHDFNNLLQAVLGAVEMVGRDRTLSARSRKHLDVAEGAVDRGATLVHRLLAFSRKQTLTPILLRPAQVLRELAPLLASALGSAVPVDIEVEEGAWPVHADGAQLDNCLLNLAVNGRDAMPDGGTLRLRAGNVGPEAARAAGMPSGEYLKFEVQDDGAGMPPEIMARALEPFFTTKSVGKGTGLGLSMVQGFARQSGGDVRIESTPGEGTTVSLWLPRARQRTGVIEVPELLSRVSARRGLGRVLVVDDEAEVRQSLSQVLTEASYTPIALESAEAALRYLHSGEVCDLLVTDQAMPGLKGSALLVELARLRPRLPTLMITGCDKVSGLAELPDGATILRKPFRGETFLWEVQKLLGDTEPLIVFPLQPLPV